MNGFAEFVESLTSAQVRALSSQVGFITWETAKVPALRAALLDSEDALEIWKAAYGKAA